jgi:3-methyl-2-oxobutanoate hydroxymethyltransferase
LTSQRSGQKGGFKAQERAVENATGLTDDGKTIEETGASALLVEAVPPEVTGLITKTISISVYIIGAGLEADE